MAGRAGIPLSMDRFDELSRTVPVLANIRPSGKYLMQDFFEAGGLRGLDVAAGPARRHDRLRADACRRRSTGAEVFDDDVIRPRSNPLSAEAGLAILRGSLAPDGCVIKHSAASPSLLSHTGPAVVFEDYADMSARIDDPDLDVDENSVLVLRNAGPLGGPGMPEWGMLPIPKKLLEQGVRDMVRISDARMSGTAYGTCVLHVAPESFVGGPLALVQTGDQITLDVPAPPPRPARLGRRTRFAAVPPGCPENAPPRAATRSSSPTTSPRPTRAATSTSSTAPAASPNPRSTDGRPLGRRHRRSRHPRPRHRPRAAAAHARTRACWCSSASPTSRPTRRPQLRRRPRRHLLQARVR